MLTVDVPAGSRLSGVEVRELRLPDDALVALVLRSGQLFVPQPGTTLRTHDQLIIVTGEQDRPRTEARLREVSRGGRLAEWHGSHPAAIAAVARPPKAGHRPRAVTAAATAGQTVISPSSARSAMSLRW